MITRKQFRIFGVFAKNPFSEHVRGQIKEESKIKSNNALSLAINQLKKDNVVLERKFGRSGILTLNMENDLTYHYIALCNFNKLPPVAKLALEILQSEIAQEIPFISVVVFGSFAISNQKKESDLDIAIFIEGEEKRKRLEACSGSSQLKSPLKLDIHIIPMQEMLEMLRSKDENLGKQIARKHMAIYNNRIFYEIIREGMRNGFRISNLSLEGTK